MTKLNEIKKIDTEIKNFNSKSTNFSNSEISECVNFVAKNDHMNSVFEKLSKK